MNTRRLLAVTLMGTVALPVVLAGCRPKKPPRDPHVQRRPDTLKENPRYLSPPTLQAPIYACASTVVVKDFVPGAKLEVFVAGNPAPIGGMQSWLSQGQNVSVTPSFTTGQVITARQTFGGATSGPSNSVTVTSHTADYPGGLPAPRIWTPCHDCGRALGIDDAVPGALVAVFTENPTGGGGFDPPVQVGSVADFPYTFISPQFKRDARVWAEQTLCSDRSPRSAAAIVQPEPSPLAAPALDPIHEGVQIVTVRGSGGAALGNGANLEVNDLTKPPGSQRVGGQPTPCGPCGQQVFINPGAPAASTFNATQALCATSPPSVTVGTVPCKDLPPAKIKIPMPGDTRIELTEFVPGAEILVFASDGEIGHGGPTSVNLSRPLVEGEQIIVLQRIGTCESRYVFVATVGCEALGGVAGACRSDWPMFRHNPLRNAQQPLWSALADPAKVKTLTEVWRFPNPPSPALAAFRASPIVSNRRVYVGNGNGRIYAINATTGTLIWQFPGAADKPLGSEFRCNPSSSGLAASAAIWRMRDGEFVIFGAPDSVGAALGSGHVYKLNASTGALVWKSPEIARVTGLTSGSTSEFHEQFGYSAPLIVGDIAYFGIANHCDNPIQNGRVVAVNLLTESVVASFTFTATGNRGGGVWSAVAGGLDSGVYITTGNTRGSGVPSEPSPNHGLSMIRLNRTTGALVWKLQPVPFSLDGDPDWASGPALAPTACGSLVMSTMKDGWSYAVETGGNAPAAPNVRWQFPPTGFPFTPGDGTDHPDRRYLVPGAIWESTFITMTGGEQVTTDVFAGFNRLHALNACAGRSARVRWVKDIPATTAGQEYQLGPPTVTRGIVFVGTTQGHLVALADPSVWPTALSRCSRPDVSVADCVANGYQIVKIPVTLANLALNAGEIRTEPVLADGRVFVATSGGRVIMLEPKP